MYKNNNQNNPSSPSGCPTQENEIVTNDLDGGYGEYKDNAISYRPADKNNKKINKHRIDGNIETENKPEQNTCNETQESNRWSRPTEKTDGPSDPTWDIF